MYHVNGFLNIGPLMNNTLGQVAILGEISESSRTFCKEKGYFSKTDCPDIELVAMHVRDSTSNEVVALSTPFANDILDILNWIVSEATAGTLGTSGSAIANNIINEFGTVIDDLTLGAPVSNGSIVLPSVIGFTFLDQPDVNSVRIWFADSAIQVEYPEYEFVIIPPVSSLDSLFESVENVEIAMAAFTRVDLTNAINTVQQDYPYTAIYADEYMNIVHSNAGGQLNTVFVIIGYGPLSANPDLRKQALIDYVLENSTHDEGDWTERFPSLFISTEFVIIPHWDKISIPNAELSSSLNSPILGPNEGLGYLEELGLGYGESWIESSYRSFGVTYKSLVVSTVGNPLNVDGETIFSTKFSDYITVTPQSADFGRMSPKTQRFVNLLNNMLPKAEVMTVNSALPSGFARITRDSNVYLAASVDNVLYLVVPRYMVIS